jgi:deoxycytidylate deaminase
VGRLLPGAGQDRRDAGHLQPTPPRRRAGQGPPDRVHRLQRWPVGLPHCDEGACPRATSDAPQGHDYGECIAIHAEANALLFSSPEERSGASLFCTGAPCFGCAKLIANSGVTEVVASGGRYEGWDDVRDFLRECGVRVRLLDGLEGVPSLDIS